jgi:orotate phosphoribosyltransferase
VIEPSAEAPVADPRTALLELLRRDALLRGDFVLSSGRRSTFYLDARRVTLAAEAAPLVGLVFLQQLQEFDIDAVAGLSLGADPIVSSIAVVSGQRAHPLDGIIVRKAAKEHGAGRRIEGPWRDGLRVAVVEDTMTTGASALDAAGAVRAAGGQVQAVWGLVDREEGAREAVEQAGYTFGAIFSIGELLLD